MKARLVSANQNGVLVSSVEVLAKGHLGEGPGQLGKTRADEWVRGPFRS